jgi:hypothetical protein
MMTLLPENQMSKFQRYPEIHVRFLKPFPVLLTLTLREACVGISARCRVEESRYSFTRVGPGQIVSIGFKLCCIDPSAVNQLLQPGKGLFETLRLRQHIRKQIPHASEPLRRISNIEL